MGVHVVADKHDIERLLMPIASDLQTTLESVVNNTVLVSFVATYYKTCHHSGAIIGSKISTTLFRSHHNFTQSTEFCQLSQLSFLLGESHGLF
jgi:hypothetical protein